MVECYMNKIHEGGNKGGHEGNIHTWSNGKF